MFEIGQSVKVPCSMSPGPFSDEHLVTVDTMDGPISGFVRSQDFFEEGEKRFLVGEVVEIDEETVTIKLRGSFFTTNGLAAVAKNRPIAA